MDLYFAIPYCFDTHVHVLTPFFPGMKHSQFNKFSVPSGFFVGFATNPWKQRLRSYIILLMICYYSAVFFFHHMPYQHKTSWKLRWPIPSQTVKHYYNNDRWNSDVCKWVEQWKKHWFWFLQIQIINKKY